MLIKLTPGDELPLKLGERVKRIDELAFTLAGPASVGVRWVEDPECGGLADAAVRASDLKHDAAPKPGGVPTKAAVKSDIERLVDRAHELHIAPQGLTGDFRLGCDYSSRPDQDVIAFSYVDSFGRSRTVTSPATDEEIRKWFKDAALGRGHTADQRLLFDAKMTLRNIMRAANPQTQKSRSCPDCGVAEGCKHFLHCGQLRHLLS